jgi:FkbM family methyltransferase
MRWRVAGKVKINIQGKSIYFYSNGDDGIVNQLYYNQNNYDEIYELKLFIALSKKSKTIIDIGANTGVYSISAAIHNPKANFFSFEPYNINLNRFKKNINLNNLANVAVIPNAMGDENGKINITIPENNQICDVVSAKHDFTNQFYKKWIKYKTQPVSVTTLDYFVIERKLNKIDLIKIDVEDFEEAVLKGGETCLKEQNPVILCEIFVTQKKIDFYKNYLKPMGYYCFLIVNSGLIKTENLFNNPGTRNFLFTKNNSEQVFYSFSDMNKIITFLSAK